MKWHCGRCLISGAGYSSVLPPAPVHLTNQAVAQDFLQTLRQIMPRMSKKTRKEKFMPVFILLVKFCCWTKIVPYCWDEEEKILKTCSSRSFHWFLVVPGGVSLIKTAYLGARFLSLYFWPTEAMTANEKILSSVLFIHWSLFGLHAVFLAALINLAMHADGVKIVCNFLLRTREERKHLWKDLTLTKICIAIYCFRMFQMTAVALSSKSPSYMYRLVPSVLQNRVTFAVYALLSTYQCFFCWVSVFSIVIVLMYLTTIEYLLKEGVDSKCIIRTALVNYKSGWILSNIHQESFSSFYLYWITLYCTLTMILCSFGILHFYGKMSTGAYLSMPISMFAIGSFSAHFYTYAGKQSGYFSTAARRRFQRVEVVSRRLQLGSTRRQPLDPCSKNNSEIADDATESVCTTQSQNVGTLFSIIRSRNVYSKWSTGVRVEMKASFRACKAPPIILGSTIPVKKSQFIKLASFVLIQTMRMLILAGST